MQDMLSAKQVDSKCKYAHRSLMKSAAPTGISDRSDLCLLLCKHVLPGMAFCCGAVHMWDMKFRPICKDLSAVGLTERSFSDCFCVMSSGS